MRRDTRIVRLGMVLACVAGWTANGRAAASDDIVIVLSSDSAPYVEALRGFTEKLGRPSPTYNLAHEEPVIPETTRVIVAIGGRAALHAYPSGRILVYCLAPGIKRNADEYNGSLYNIYMSPNDRIAVAKFKELQPALKRIAVLWSSPLAKDYIRDKTGVAETLGVEIVSDNIHQADELPDHLRALRGTVDAIWLPPDAALVTRQNFTTIRGFALANGIPFYAPSEGLVEQGALASVTPSFNELGALAAETALKASLGQATLHDIFPEATHVALNLTTAKACHLDIPEAVRKHVNRVVP